MTNITVDKDLLEIAVGALRYNLDCGVWGSDIEGIYAALLQAIGQSDQAQKGTHIVRTVAQQQQDVPETNFGDMEQPLTDDEISKIWGSYFSRGLEFARAIEAAHGIKEK